MSAYDLAYYTAQRVVEAANRDGYRTAIYTGTPYREGAVIVAVLNDDGTTRRAHRFDLGDEATAEQCAVVLDCIADDINGAAYQ